MSRCNLAICPPGAENNAASAAFLTTRWQRRWIWGRSVSPPSCWAAAGLPSPPGSTGQTRCSTSGRGNVPWRVHTARHTIRTHEQTIPVSASGGRQRTCFTKQGLLTLYPRLCQHSLEYRNYGTICTIRKCLTVPVSWEVSLCSSTGCEEGAKRRKSPSAKMLSLR